MRPFIIVITLFIIVVINACNNKSAKEPAKVIVPELSREELIKRGEYLVQITGCNNCHSPKKPGPNGPELVPELMLSGFTQDMPLPQADSNILKAGYSVNTPDLTATAGPWGISFASNLTPDSASGIKTMTEEQFRNAMKGGRYRGRPKGRMLQSPMPWPSYAKMTDEDVKAIYTYLQSIPPVNNNVHSWIKWENMY